MLVKSILVEDPTSQREHKLKMLAEVQKAFTEWRAKKTHPSQPIPEGGIGDRQMYSTDFKLFNIQAFFIDYLGPTFMLRLRLSGKL